MTYCNDALSVSPVRCYCSDCFTLATFHRKRMLRPNGLLEAQTSPDHDHYLALRATAFRRILACPISDPICGSCCDTTNPSLAGGHRGDAAGRAESRSSEGCMALLLKLLAGQVGTYVPYVASDTAW